MEAKELFKSGNLQGTIDQLIQEVKNKPLDLSKRIFLFETLCFAADYQRAERQLDAIAQTSGDVNVEMGILVYRSVLKAEKERDAFFTGALGAPKFLSEPPAYTALHLQAVAELRVEKFTEIEKLLDESASARGSLKGAKDGNPFSDFKDADDILAPFLEIFLQGEYCWLPFSEVKELTLQAPSTLRDLLWVPARVALHHRALGDVFVPVQYFGSSKHENDLVKLGRMTDWKSVAGGTLLGAGQRTLLVDEVECPILEIRKIEFSESL
jgi:type VI secretion system protein ImpE